MTKINCASAAMLAAAMILASCGSGEPAAPAEPPVAVGTAVNVKSAEVTVTSVETRKRVGIEYMYENASEGATLVIVSHTLKNIGDKPLGMFSTPSLTLVDPAGTEYRPDVAKSAAYATESKQDAKVMSDLNPGITTRGADVFEIAEDRFDPATWQIKVTGTNQRLALQ